MEQKNTSVFYNSLIWGIIIGLVSVIYSVVLYILDLSLNRTLGLLSLLILLAGLVIAILNYRDSVRGGFISFGTAFSFGILVAVFAGVISSIYTYVQMTVIDPGMQDKIIEMASEKYLEKGVPEDQLDTVMEFSKKFMSPVFMTISGIFQSAVLGVVLSLIIAAIFKRNNPEEEIGSDGAV
jgi:hypothetical protein